MSLLGATILTAIATLVLAVGAVITAVLAGQALGKQSEGVRILQKQAEDAADLLQVQSDQLDVQRDQFESLRKVSEKQAEVLGLQAKELQESLAERKREAEERRRSQAAGVTAWLADDEHPFGGRLLAAVLSNQSDQPIYDAQANLQYLDERRPGTEWAPAAGGASQVIKIVVPHTDIHVGISEHARPYLEEDDDMAFAASILFTDAARNRWERSPSGALNQVPPDRTYLFGNTGSER